MKNNVNEINDITTYVNVRNLYKAKKTNKEVNDNKEWATGSYINRNGYSIIYEFENNQENDYLVDDTTLCQYSGFKTKTGQLIFENDILQSEYGDIAQVKFGEYLNCFDPEEMKHYGFYVNWQNENYYVKDLKYWIEKFNAKVIGNIFDNAEILQK